ncbi:MAG: hypothetical protein ACOC8D_02325 [bacterium]
MARYLAGLHGQAWDDVQKARDLGLTVSPAFIEALKKASGRER